MLRFGFSGGLALVILASSAMAERPDHVAPAIIGMAQVVDGDTLRLSPETIRIHGIDAPEAGQICNDAHGRPWQCGQAATARMAELVSRHVVECIPTDRDAYGRIVAVCRAGGVDIAGDLIDRGLAWAFVRYSSDYAVAESRARQRKVGIWQGAAQPAWDFRAGRWQETTQTAAGDGNACPIKGNISSKGERIYHTPWSPAYAKTRIDESKGERWFCDEAEAVAAGWRAARWR